MKALALAFTLLITGCATAGSAPEPPKKKVQVLEAPVSCTHDGRKCAVVVKTPDGVILIPINVAKVCIWSPV